jgi:S-adenosylmethionine hydrolase
MGRSQETLGKKEVRNKKEKKRKEKLEKREKKKNEGKSTFNDMIAYVDEFGKIRSTPQGPERKVIFDA